MKNVDVAWRLIDVVREWQKLKKMTSMLLLHPGFKSVCLNSCVLATATIGLKTKQKKSFTLMIRILQLVASGGITIFRTFPLSYIYIYLIPKLMLSLIFGQSNYTDRKFRPLLPIADFKFHLDFHYHKEENCW